MNQTLSKCKWVFAILLLSGCVHQMELSKQTMKKVDAKVVNKTFWLKQSLYFGPFYDDDRYFLVNPNPFDEVKYLKMPDGQNILPPDTKSIIPVGTKVTVQTIEWPDLHNYWNRPIFTPRSMPWMKLKFAMDRGHVSLQRPQTFIYLLPINADNADQFETWFQTIFSEADTNPWFLGLTPEAQKAVLEKKAVKGMPKEALIAALGEPDSWSKEKEIANYKKQVVVLENNVVSKIQTLNPSTPE